MIMGPSQLWLVNDAHWKIQTRPLVKEGVLHDEESTRETKEHVKSGHGPQRAARHQDILADWPSVANLTPLHKTEQWEAIEESRGSSEVGRVPAQRRQFELRSLASLAVWLDQEEELVHLV
jgi:hypothetical protein